MVRDEDEDKNKNTDQYILEDTDISI